MICQIDDIHGVLAVVLFLKNYFYFYTHCRQSSVRTIKYLGFIVDEHCEVGLSNQKGLPKGYL